MRIFIIPLYKTCIPLSISRIKTNLSHVSTEEKILHCKRGFFAPIIVLWVLHTGFPKKCPILFHYILQLLSDEN